MKLQANTEWSLQERCGTLALSSFDTNIVLQANGTGARIDTLFSLQNTNGKNNKKKHLYR